MQPLDDVIRRFLRPGDHLHFAYGEGRPQAAMNALVRVFWNSQAAMTVSGGGFVMSAYGLVHGAVASRLIGSFFGENYPTPGPNPELARAYRDGTVTFEPWSLLTLVQRLAAGAFHLPFFPSRSLIGSNMTDDLGESVRPITDPFGGPDLMALPPLTPDVTFLHVPVAEPSGRFMLAPPYGEGYLGALAARRGCIVTAERLVDDGTLPASQVHLPADRVLATVEAPFGAHPYGMWDAGCGYGVRYREDRAFASEARRGFKEAPDGWLRRWILDPGGHDAYLAQLGDQRLGELRKEAPLALRSDDGATTPRERLVFLGAQYIQERTADGIRMVLAGVGLANLASWLAYERTDGAFLLSTEIGMHSYKPVAGDPYLFALPTMETGQGFLGTLEILGSMVSDPDRPCMGVLGAAQVDRHGRVNSTRLGDRWLVGSGGANDIASTAAEVVVFTPAGTNRLVDEVSFATSPGERTRAIITELGVLERAPGASEFELTRVTGGGVVADGIRRFREACGWNVRVADCVVMVPDPEPPAVRRLRQFDPHRDFL